MKNSVDGGEKYGIITLNSKCSRTFETSFQNLSLYVNGFSEAQGAVLGGGGRRSKTEAGTMQTRSPDFKIL